MRKEIYYICLTEPKEGLETCIRTLEDKSTQFDKITAIEAMGSLSSSETQRDAYTVLINLLENSFFATSAIVSLGQLKDTRALFPLVNYFNNTKNIQIQRYILGYMFETKDPRASEFLQDYVTKEKSHSKAIAKMALQNCKDNAKILYSFAGSDEQYNHALRREYTPIFVSSENLEKYQNVIERNKQPNDKPQTYIISEDEKIVIGGEENEHVTVAAGKKVFGAGEMRFEKQDEFWTVSYINNRSYGYYPHENSFQIIKKFFKKTDILFQKETFDETFPRNRFNDPEFLAQFMYADL